MFRSRFSEQVDDEYRTTDDYLAEKARAAYGEDIALVRTYEAEDGERLTLMWWRDPESLARWRVDLEHRNAQRKGRDTWYSFYELSVTEVLRTGSTLPPEAYPAP
ncbi:antibiotic biosynthesis monooxygenase [Kitasatospora sp. NPDC036755]|uniref:antibiotic biosynthesis monooxygenase family protein n=1 Tax=Kitasatospora sp. NPDC036755 TaxID=3154600 RepID=UPI00340BA0F6